MTRGPDKTHSQRDLSFYNMIIIVIKQIQYIRLIDHYSGRLLFRQFRLQGVPKKELRFQKEITRIGQRIAKLRVSKDLSQRKLADLANIPFASLNSIENGAKNPTVNTLYAIADALEVPLKELLQRHSRSCITQPNNGAHRI